MQPDKALSLYKDLLLKWQKTINLVSPATLADIQNRHFNDGQQLVDYIPKSVKNLCDIGSGAGFPGLIIAIYCPDLQVHLIESDARKCAFLRTVSRETGCTNVTIHNDRIEAVIGDMTDMDCLTSRALASLRQLMTYAKPLWVGRPDFQMILPKGANYLSEIAEAEKTYSFTCRAEVSKTDDAARILIVNNIACLKD